MNKSHRSLWSILSVIVIFSFAIVLAGEVQAASTIGTNMSTTGTFTLTTGSATAARFQDAAGSLNALVIDTVNTRVGVGTAPTTTFEVQGTASASYFMTTNTIQVGGVGASVAYNRFGSVATTHSLSNTNDVLINGKFEVDSIAFFDNQASVAGDFEVVGKASASRGFFTTSLVVGSNVASSSLYKAEFGGSAGTASVSVLFGSSSATSFGTCLQMKSTAGRWVYARVLDSDLTALVLSSKRCE